MSVCSSLQVTQEMKPVATKFGYNHFEVPLKYYECTSPYERYLFMEFDKGDIESKLGVELYHPTILIKIKFSKNYNGTSGPLMCRAYWDSDVNGSTYPETPLATVQSISSTTYSIVSGSGNSIHGAPMINNMGIMTITPPNERVANNNMSVTLRFSGFGGGSQSANVDVMFIPQTDNCIMSMDSGYH